VPEDAEEGEARGEVQEHLVAPKRTTNTVSIHRLRRAISMIWRHFRGGEKERSEREEAGLFIATISWRRC
jgi:hypothetical protein